MLTETVIDCPADRISIGKTSLGTNQPNGPHDHANAATYMQIKPTVTFPSAGLNVPRPSCPNTLAMMAPIAICNKTSLISVSLSVSKMLGIVEHVDYASQQLYIFLVYIL